MTTTVKVTAHGANAKVELKDGDTVAETRVVKPGDGQVTFNATTTRSVHVIDVEAGLDAT